MGNRIVITREAVTPVAGEDIITYVSAAGRRARVVQASVGGAGTTSAAQRARLSRSTGGTTGGGALTPNKFDHTDQPSAVGTVNTTWSAQPTADTHGYVLGWNALGGKDNWIPPAGKAIEARNGENISLRAVSGPTYQACNATLVIEED